MANKINANFTNNKISVSTSSNSKVIVQKGGPVTQLGIGTVTVLAAGEDPTVEVSGAPSNPVLDFGLPASPNELQLLSDVEIAALADGDTIVYSEADGKFKNAQPAAGGGVAPWFQRVTATGSVTVPAGVSVIEVQCIGGGGGGGGGATGGDTCATDSIYAAGGGAAGVSSTRYIDVAEGDVLDCTIGAGGTGGAGAPAFVGSNINAGSYGNAGQDTKVLRAGVTLAFTRGGTAGQAGHTTSPGGVSQYGIYATSSSAVSLPGSGGDGNAGWSAPSAELGQIGGGGGTPSANPNGGSGGGANSLSVNVSGASPTIPDGHDGTSGNNNTGNGGGGGGGGAPGGKGGTGGNGGSGLVIIRAVG
jgi:hypothetical protein